MLAAKGGAWHSRSDSVMVAVVVRLNQLAVCFACHWLVGKFGSSLWHMDSSLTEWSVFQSRQHLQNRLSLIEIL